MFYVYALFRPDGRICYIGKGQRDRINNHEYQSERGIHTNPHLMRIICKAKRKDMSIPKVILHENLDEITAYDYEKILIKAIGRTNNDGPLVNMTDGGEGFSGKHTENTRFKMSKSHCIRYQSMTIEDRKVLNDKISNGKRNGKQLSREARAKQATSQQGRIAWNKGLKGIQIPWNKGRKCTPEEREKFKWSNERKNKASERLKGIKPLAAIAATLNRPRKSPKPFSIEHRLNISIARKGKPHPHKGVPRSAETRAKLSKIKLLRALQRKEQVIEKGV